jgi:uncharacterized protein
VAALVILAALAGACTGAETDPSTGPETSVEAPAPDIEAADLADPLVSLDAEVMDRRYAAGLDLFEYDESAPLRVERGPPVASGSEAFDRFEISYASPRGGRATATLLVPHGPGPFPAMILQHGLPGTRLDTLARAGRYAASGVVTLSVDAPFARRGPAGLANSVSFTSRDRRDQIQLIVDLRRAVDLLTRRDDIDPDRIAYLGVSYGGAMGGLLAGIERRIKSYVLAVGDGGLVEHFTADGAGLERLSPARRRSWLTAMEPIEPLYFVRHAAPSELLFQNALEDEAVALEDAARYQRAGSEPKDTLWYESGHFLPVEAHCDAAAWLRERLQFSGDAALAGCDA